MIYPENFDVIVVGGGHAGTEAALTSARMGKKTLLITQNINTIGQMSCNPAIGGIGKGQLVKEIDALGGVMGEAIDEAGIQFRILNSSKGPAVQATRAQADRSLYRKAIRMRIQNQPNLMIFQQLVEDLIVKNHQIIGIKTKMDLDFYAKSVVITAGTFLNGKIHIGMENYQGGRAGDEASISFAQNFHHYGFNISRLKTGTPPRIDIRSINLDILPKQFGDSPIPYFSFLGKPKNPAPQIACFVTQTNEKTHEIIRNNLDRSPLYAGKIESIGPRYCPSVEDKIVRFSDKTSHNVYLEPEGLSTTEVYPNGISTSLPFDVQFELVRSIKGLEKAVIMQPGYAIEYDYFDPRDLHLTLESKKIRGLFFAGQTNGTTGYEEAAAQGLLAGLNAALFASGEEGFIPKRNEAYLGVLVDDICTLGAKEPYRMFTSRAEFRLTLREDNADFRLTEIGRKFGLVDDFRWKTFNEKYEKIERERARLKAILVHPNSKNINELNQLLNKNLSKEANGEELLKRPEIDYVKLMSISPFSPGIEDPEVAKQVEILAKYEGYIQRQKEEVIRQDKNETILLPETIIYAEIPGLSNEVVAKLNEVKPNTIGQASRIQGITPASISMILIWLKKNNFVKKEKK